MLSTFTFKWYGVCTRFIGIFLPLFWGSLHPAYPFYHLNHIAMNSSTKFVLGAIVGAVVGVQIGILIAPDKGSNTRKKITKKGGEYLDDFTGKINGLLDNLTRKVTDASQEVDKLAKKAKQETEKLVSK